MLSKPLANLTGLTSSPTRKLNFDIKLLTPFVDLATKQLITWFQRETTSLKYAPSNLTNLLNDHLRYVIKWSEQTYFPTASHPSVVAEQTIDLRFHETPRKFRVKSTHRNELSEDDLLTSSTNLLLLGDPGSGKTTTAKRLLQRTLSEAWPGSSSSYCFPLLIKIRDLDTDIGLIDQLGVLLAVPNVPDNIEKKEKELSIRERRDNIVTCVSNGPFLVCIDGLDEAREAMFPSFVKEAILLATSSIKSRIIATCRSGAYTFTPEGFDVCEILPLTEIEVRRMAKLLMKDWRSFNNALKRATIRNMANRPLLVAHMIFLYKNTGYLPDRLCDLYFQIVELLVRAWNENNFIFRESKYSGFDPSKKLRFLQNLAFQLLLHDKKQTFRRQDLEAVYHRICDLFRLPESESRMVAQELETHNGIIVESGLGRYEFFHLTIQEYLAAGYIVEGVRDQRLAEFFNVSPSTVAIAVAMAHDSVGWLEATAKLQGLGVCSFTYTLPISEVSEFLDRLVMEAPIFEKGQRLAVASLRLLVVFDVKILEHAVPSIRRFFSIESVYLSIVQSLPIIESKLVNIFDIYLAYEGMALSMMRSFSYLKHILADIKPDEA